MIATRELEAAMYKHITPVLMTLLEVGEDKSELPERRQAAGVITGLLTSVRLSIVRAGTLFKETELDDHIGDVVRD